MRPTLTTNDTTHMAKVEITAHTGQAKVANFIVEDDCIADSAAGIADIAKAILARDGAAADQVLCVCKARTDLHGSWALENGYWVRKEARNG